MAAQRGTPQQRSLERRSISAAIIKRDGVGGDGLVAGRLRGLGVRRHAVDLGLGDVLDGGQDEGDELRRLHRLARQDVLLQGVRLRHQRLLQLAGQGLGFGGDYHGQMISL